MKENSKNNHTNESKQKEMEELNKFLWETAEKRPVLRFIHKYNRLLHIVYPHCPQHLFARIH